MFDALQWTELLWGSGLATLAVVAAIAWSGRPAWLDVGLVGGAAAVLALLAVGEVSVLAPLGAVALAVASRLGFDKDEIEWRRLELIVVGAMLVLIDIGSAAGGRLIVAAVVTAVIAWVLSLDFLRHQPTWSWLIVIAGSAAGVYANVPDTEAIAAVLGAASAMAGIAVVGSLFGWSDRFVIRAPGVALLVALVFGSAADGARGRDVAFIGVVGVLGVLASHAIAQALRRGARSHPVVLVVVHAVVVLAVSRLTIGETATDARWVVVVALAAALPLVLLARQA